MTDDTILFDATVSDLFFNHEHDKAWVPQKEGGYYDRDAILQSATEFRRMLVQIGVADERLPTPEEMSTDFFERL